MNKDPCSKYGQVINGTTAGEILFPSQPDAYPDNAYCKWRIEVDDGSLVQLKFENFNLEDR